MAEQNYVGGGWVIFFFFAFSNAKWFLDARAGMRHFPRSVSIRDHGVTHSHIAFTIFVKPLLRVRVTRRKLGIQMSALNLDKHL
jgi:hypothetical protein